jgi:lysophospholipase L1-like esterase
MANLAAIVERLRLKGDVPILIYTLSPIVPGEALACYQGIEETVSERIRRFNLGLIDLSRDTGVHLVDVDRLVAEKGADALKRDAVHLSPAAYRLAAHEVVRILLEIGLLEEEP